MNNTFVKEEFAASPLNICANDESAGQENSIQLIMRLAKGHVTENATKTAAQEEVAHGNEEWEDVADSEEDATSFDLPGLSGLFDYLEARIALRKKSLLLAPTPIHLRAPASAYSEQELIEGLIACGYNVVTLEQFNLPPFDVTKPPCIVLIRRPGEWQSALETAWASYAEDIVWLIWHEAQKPLNLPLSRWLVFDLFLESNRPVLINLLWTRFGEWLELPDPHLPPDFVNDLCQLPEHLLEAAILALAHVVSRGVDLDEPFDLYSLPLLSHLNTENLHIRLKLESVRLVVQQVLDGLNGHHNVKFIPKGRLVWLVYIAGDVFSTKTLRLTMTLREKRYLQFTLEGTEPCSAEAAADLIVLTNNWSYEHPDSPTTLIQLEKGVQLQQCLLVDIESRSIRVVKQHLSSQITAALEFWTAVNKNEAEESE